MNDIEKIARITEEQVEGASVEALSNRPNDKTGFRRGGLSAQELKVYFSALAMLSVHKVNEIISAIGDEGAESDLLKLLYTALPEDADDEKRLSLSRWVAKVEGELKDVPAMLLRASETLSAFEGATAEAKAVENGNVPSVSVGIVGDRVLFTFSLPRGDAGYTPQKGKDYFTDEDINSIVPLVLDAMPQGEGTVVYQNGVALSKWDSDSKLDKLKPPSATSAYVINQDGTHSAVALSSTVQSGTIVIRASNGRILAGDPVKDSDVVTLSYLKNYVSEEIAKIPNAEEASF